MSRKGPGRCYGMIDFVEDWELDVILHLATSLNLVNASYLFTHISYLEKTYTTTAQEPSIYVTNFLQYSIL